MADEKRTDTDPLKNQEPDPRMDEFKKSPDPWKEIAQLTWGGDRTHASTIQTLIMDADPSQYPAFEKKLLGLVTAHAYEAAGLDFVCRMLRLIGSPASVPVLAPLLADEKTADAARHALQTIPGTEVSAALRAALPALKGRPKAGLIGTLAARGDRDAQAAIQAIAKDPSETAEVREAAALAAATLGGAQ